MKKILFVSNSSWNLYNFRKPLIDAFVKQGHQVQCACKESRASFELLSSLGVHSIYSLDHVEARGKNPLKDIFLFVELFRLFIKIKPNVVLLYTPKLNVYGGMAARILKLFYINNITGLGSEFTKKMNLPFYIRFLFSMGLKKSFCVVSHNSEDSKYLIERKIVDRRKSLVIAGSGIDTDFFKSIRKVQKVETFLFSGRFLVEKGVIEYLEAAMILAPLYPNIHWVLVGDNYGVKSSRLSQLLEGSKRYSNIQIFEFTDNIRKYYENCDCFVLPTYREGMSKSLLEAMSMERIVIASDVPGCKEAITNKENGFLSSVQNTNELKKVMLESIMLNDQQVRDMVTKARQKVKDDYSKEIIVQKYNELIRRA